MPNINDMMPSRFLTKENVTPQKVVSFSNIQIENIANDNEAPKMKVVLYFNEFNQGMVLNKINKELIILALGTGETDQWIGKQITLWNDRSVGFGDKITGGIRVLLPQGQMVQPQNNQFQNNQPQNNQPQNNQPQNDQFQNDQFQNGDPNY